jgi:hypothetical protein
VGRQGSRAIRREVSFAKAQGGVKAGSERRLCKQWEIRVPTLCAFAFLRYASFMDADRSKAAMARIEAALARIEGAARAPRVASTAPELAELQARHDRLREAVQDSLEQLDQLIEGAQG